MPFDLTSQNIQVKKQQKIFLFTKLFKSLESWLLYSAFQVKKQQKTFLLAELFKSLESWLLYSAIQVKKQQKHLYLPNCSKV